MALVLLRGCLTEKKSLVKIGEPSHMSTRFFATRFFQMPARGRGGKSEGAKKTPRIFQTEFFLGCLLRTWWGIGGAKKHPPHSALPSNLPAPTLACAASGGQALGSGGSKGQQSIDDRGLAPLRSSMASPHLY